MDAIEKFKAKLPWLFGNHYKMERFGIVFGLLVLLFVTDFGFILKKKANDERQQLGSQVMYTTNFRMSLSGAKGTVKSVHVSKDGTKCFIMLKWDSMNSVATDASKYSVFLTGTNLSLEKETLQSHPVGSLYLFGTTGYMGIYLVDVDGFPNQILDMTIRSENNFRSSKGPYKDSRGDPSFTQYDQARIYFNPGGSSRKTTTCLEDDSPSAMSGYGIYESLYCESKEADIRKQMDEQLVIMKNCLMKLSEYEYRIEQDGLQLPNRPSIIRGDYIVEADDGTLELVTENNCRGSHIFDWRNGSVREGYIDALIQAGGYPTYAQYFSAKSKETGRTSEYSSDVTWYYKNGEPFVYNSSTTSSVLQSVNNDINLLIGVWDQFYAAKKMYQVDLPRQLLDLETDAIEMTSTYTTNTSKGFVTRY